LPNFYIKKRYLIIFARVFSFLLLAVNFTGCSISYKGENNLEKKDTNISREIIDNFSKAIANYPNNFYFYLERGKARQDYGDFKGAIDDFYNAFKINPDKRYLFYAANSKFDYGDYEGAIKDYKNLIYLKEFKEQVFYNLASSQLINFNYEDSIINYSKSIEYDPDDEYAYLNRGNAKFKIMDNLGSLEDYNKSIKINKKSYITLKNRGVTNSSLVNIKQL